MLLIAYQMDFSSCGVFALNALMHHLIPSQYSLCTSNDMVMMHIELLALILDHHTAQVSKLSTTVTKLRLTLYPGNT